MQKVVTNGLKIDLHIHSSFSSLKDGAKVKGNTIANIPLLVQKLDEQQVNLCAITDHDTFSYDMYVALKNAETEQNSIQKVLPGVEFSVCFSAQCQSAAKGVFEHLIAEAAPKFYDGIGILLIGRDMFGICVHCCLFTGQFYFEFEQERQLQHSGKGRSAQAAGVVFVRCFADDAFEQFLQIF